MYRRVVSVALAGGLLFGLGLTSLLEAAGVTPDDSADTFLPSVVVGLSIALFVIAHRS